MQRLKTMRRSCPHRLKAPMALTAPKDSSMSNGDFSPWTLDGSDSKRQPYTKSEVKRGETERLQVRADAFHVRRIDEIVASRINPMFKTRSDVLQDALAMWLEQWDVMYPDGATGELSYQARLETMKRKRRYRADFLATAQEELTSLREDGDIEGLSSILQTLLMAQGDFKDDAPSSYLAKMDSMILEARRLLDAHRAI